MLATMNSFHPQVSHTWLMLTTPLYFGIAHLHHAWEMYQAGGCTNRARTSALLTSALQFVYTTVFGWYASFLFMRTGTVWAPLLAHVLCNVMGLPRLAPFPYANTVQKAACTCAHLAGLGAFMYALWPLTSTHMSATYS